jgi:dipeptidyl aminopeptidase/acylaminoacyl peptidase
LWFYHPNEGVKKMTEKPYPQLSSFKWSRDGNRLVFIANAPETADLKIYNRYIPLRMYVLSVTDGTVKTIADGMDFFRGGENLTWSGNDAELWFTNGEGVGYNLFAVDVASGTPRYVTTGKDCVSLASFSNDFTKIAFIRQNVNVKPDIYISDIATWNPHRITDLNTWIKDYDNEDGEIITYQSEGWEIEALLIKPPGFSPDKKYPLLLITHGGPNWHKLNEWLPDWEQYPLKAFAAEGYVMLFPNFRGSANYGVDFIKTTHHDLGGMDFRDAMRGVDYLLEQGFIDEDNMGVCGWSYGGFLTPSIITQTTRFKAAQFGAGLPSIEGMYASLWTVERILHKAFDVRPWENAATHIQYSPLYYANKVKTPTLIQHGDKDPRCPVGGAVLFYKALKSYGVPTVLEIYPEMGHSITDPLLYKRILTKNLEWFNKWLKDDKSTSFETIFPYEKYASYHVKKQKDR